MKYMLCNNSERFSGFKILKSILIFYANKSYKNIDSDESVM